MPRKHTTASDATATSAFDEEAIRREFQKLPSHLRIQLLGIILDACLPGDIATMSKTLEKHLRMTRDVVSGLPDTVALKIFEKLPIQDCSDVVTSPRSGIRSPPHPISGGRTL